MRVCLGVVAKVSKNDGEIARIEGGNGGSMRSGDTKGRFVEPMQKMAGNAFAHDIWHPKRCLMWQDVVTDGQKAWFHKM